MIDVKTYLLKCGNKRLKLQQLSKGTFHIAVTEGEFCDNPCFVKTSVTEEILEFGCKEKNEENFEVNVSDNIKVCVNYELTKIQFMQVKSLEKISPINFKDEHSENSADVMKEKFEDVLLDISEVECFLKEINGNSCYGNRFNISKEENEKFYGLGQHQTNTLNYNNSKVNVYHDYKAKGGEVIGIPFLYSSKGYGLINSTLAQSIVDFTHKSYYLWETDWAIDFSVYVIFGSPEKIYKELANITGRTTMPLKASLGYIQCKQRYESEEEILQVAKSYREKHYPLDMMVVDWFYWKTLGDMSMNPEFWPDPSGMNRWLKDHDIDTMISVWPRFMKDSDYYDELEAKGWFVKDEAGQTVYGTEEDQRGALIDTTNPDCGEWYWNTIYNNLGKHGFNAWWTDENEPDLWPYDYQLDGGKGYEIFNLYPYTHVKSIYEGHLEAYDTRCVILSRSAYLGSQRFGTQFWSSDIYPTWGVLEKQIPAAINFCASGMGYWSSDIGGWQALPDYTGRSTFGVDELLIETQGSSTGVVTSKDYPELYIRWFQFSVFCPILRAHGTRDENEIWSYGEEAEKILADQLTLRYQLMPYIYSMAYKLHAEGMPLLRGLFMEFPNDNEGYEIKDQYMFGDGIMVAPVIKPGQKSRRVYFPKGGRWYDFYGDKVYEGGTYASVTLTLNHIPVFVKENYILPLGSPVESTKDKIEVLTLYIYGEEPKDFVLYEDDGRTYKYESGVFDLYKIECRDKKVMINNRKTEDYSTGELPWRINIVHH